MQRCCYEACHGEAQEPLDAAWCNLTQERKRKEKEKQDEKRKKEATSVQRKSHIIFINVPRATEALKLKYRHGEILYIKCSPEEKRVVI